MRPARFAWAGLAVVLTAFDGSVLVLALPAIAGPFEDAVGKFANDSSSGTITVGWFCLMI